jgi:uncharacterized membrane protein
MSLLIFVLSIAALVVALKVLRDSRPLPGQPTSAERMASLEERVRDLLFRVWTLERQAGGQEPAASPAAEVLHESASAEPVATPLVTDAEPAPSSAWSAAEAAVQGAVVHTEPPAAAAEPVPAMSPASGLNLEQRIGARWTTWVGVVAIIFAASFAVKLSIENDLIGPRARLGLGMSAGITLLTAGLALHRRRDVPYLSEGLSGLGLGLCYLSLYAGYAYYGLLPAGAAFGLMFIVTVLGSGVAVVSDRQGLRPRAGGLVGAPDGLLGLYRRMRGRAPVREVRP